MDSKLECSQDKSNSWYLVSSSLTLICNQDKIKVLSNYITTLNKFDSVNHCKSKPIILTVEENIAVGENHQKSKTPKLYAVSPIK